MTDHEYTVLCPFGGSGGGALGFAGAEVRLLGHVGRFRCLGSIDFDASACRDFEHLTGAPAWNVDIETITAGDVLKRYGMIAPDVVFMSPPCKGSSRLLSSALAATDTYQRMNNLAVVWTRVMLEAWGDDPPALMLLENVPGLPTRAKAMLTRLRKMLKAAGYVFHASTHDCGEVGGLAQHRGRYLLVARHPKKAPSLLHKPVKRRVRGIGEVLGELPIPMTRGAARWGDLHVMPKLAWRNWLRLALIPAGGDWRDLEGVLEGRARREVFRRHAVADWNEPSEAVTGPGGMTVGAVADPRVAPQSATKWNRGAYGVRGWDEASGVVTGAADHPSRGTFSVADPRLAEALPVAPAFDAAYAVLGWKQPARTVAGNNAVGCGAYSVADPRELGFVGGVRFLTLDETMTLDLDPAKAPPFVPVIVAEDGAWHRPMTLLELARLQDYPLEVRGEPVRFDGGRVVIAEHIGNSVPVGAARAIAEQMLTTLIESSIGSMSLSATGAWVDRASVRVATAVAA